MPEYPNIGTNSRTLAVDFDGVLHDWEHPIPHRRMGGVIAGAKEAIDELKRQGHKIIIFCVWAGNEQGDKTIKDWMNYYHVQYDEITNIKPNASLFIDDRGLYFKNWEQTMAEINERLV